MRLIGFNFIKINAEKTTDINKNLKINNGIDVSEIREVKSDLLKTKEEILGITFEHTITYNPGIAKLSFTGNILLEVDSSLAREIIKKWKDKQIPEKFRLSLFNAILKKSSLKALQIEEELNLPPHFPLPSLKSIKDENSK